MPPRDYRKPGRLILLTLFLLACVSPLSGTPTPVPISEAKMRQTLDAALIRTAAAAETQTAAMMTPTRTPTITRTPSQTPIHLTSTPTFIYLLPTYTVTPTPTATFNIYATFVLFNSGKIKLSDGTEVPGPLHCFDGCLQKAGPSCNALCREHCREKCQWRCNVRSSPHPVVNPKEKFTARWVVANIGLEAWTSKTIDFVYRGGIHHEGLTTADIRSTVRTGGTIALDATFIAPNGAGEYRSFYVLKVDATKTTEFCPLWMTIEVVP